MLTAFCIIFLRLSTLFKEMYFSFHTIQKWQKIFYSDSKLRWNPNMSGKYYFSYSMGFSSQKHSFTDSQVFSTAPSQDMMKSGRKTNAIED